MLLAGFLQGKKGLYMFTKKRRPVKGYSITNKLQNRLYPTGIYYIFILKCSFVFMKFYLLILGSNGTIPCFQLILILHCFTVSEYKYSFIMMLWALTNDTHHFIMVVFYFLYTQRRIRMGTTNYANLMQHLREEIQEKVLIWHSFVSLPIPQFSHHFLQCLHRAEKLGLKKKIGSWNYPWRWIYQPRAFPM